MAVRAPTMYVGPPLHHLLTSPGLLTALFTPGPLPMSSMTHASRSIDEAKRSASQLQSSSLAAVFGLGQVQVKWRVEMPLTQHPVNESLLNHDERSPRDGVGCPDAHRARKPSSTSAPNDEVLSDHFLTVNAGHVVNTMNTMNSANSVVNTTKV